METPTIQKYIEQVERKRQYNRSYYHAKVKPKREVEREELEVYRKKCQEYENNEASTHSQLQKEIQNLSEQIQKYKQENKALRDALEMARQRNYELTIQRVDEFLPNVKGLTL